MKTTTADIIHPVLYFDGVCNLCNATVQFIIKHDKKEQFRFATLQSETGSVAKTKVSLSAASGSVILFDGGKYYTKSDAALRVLKHLGGLWRVGYAAILIPGFIRNAVYDMVARKRYKWFGQSDACMVPTAELNSRFLP